MVSHGANGQNDGSWDYEILVSDTYPKNSKVVPKVPAAVIYTSVLQVEAAGSSETMQKSSVSTGFAEQIMPILHILRYNGSLATWMVVSLTTAKFMPPMFLPQSSSL
jgi:hypothetical protein